MTADWVLGKKKKKKEDRLLIRIYAPTFFKRDLAIIKVGKKNDKTFLKIKELLIEADFFFQLNFMPFLFVSLF